MNQAQFATLEQMIVATAEAVRPPERLTVSQAAAKYRWLNNPGHYVGPWDNDKAPYLVEPMDEMTNLDFTGLAFIGPARTGKALPLDTPIPTPTGWTTMGELSLGSHVLSESGDVTSVIGATDTMYGHDCYRITFDDGAKIVADAGHKWAVDDVFSENSKVIDTATLFEKYRIPKPNDTWRSRYAIPIHDGLQLRDVDLPIDPYLFGVWLGDGSVASGYLNLNDWDCGHIIARLEATGHKIHSNWEKQNCNSYYVKCPSGRSLGAILRRNKLGPANHIKRIPAAYLRSSEAQRRALLHGLMDTDGTVDSRNPRCSIALSDENLIGDVSELLTSLGIKNTLDIRSPFYTLETGGDRHYCKDSYRLSFTVYDAHLVFSLPRQVEKHQAAVPVKPKPSQIKRRWVRNVEPVESVPVRCIQVDNPKSLFLAGKGMIPTHNSDMFFNWLAYTAICDPADMMSVDMTQNTARDWSKGDLRKMLRHSKEVGARIKPGRQNQNVHDIDFMSGMRLLVKWPVISELSGKTIPRLWIRDYDRMTQNVDGEGNPFDLTRKRAQTFGRYGMCVAEASPGFPVINAKWSASHPHEAPPCDGILSIYNRGDRRRWYWRCLQCDHAFEAKFKDFHWPDSTDFMESAEQVSLPCPSCGYPHTQEMKHDLNLGGKWIKQGQTWLPDHSVDGDPKRSDIASFWLMGPAAAFASWESIVFKFLQANDDYERTGSEESLKTTVNVDQGLPYTYKAIEAGRTSDELKDRAEDWGGSAEYVVVPEDGRFLIKTVDVQARSFVVQTHAVFANGDIAIIETKKLRRSILTDENGEWQAIDPAARPEDWDVLIDELKQTYPLADGSGRHMRIKIMGCDSGGKDGVTANAYAFWRRLRAEGGDLHSRFHLIKGDGSKTAPRLALSYPDASRKDKFAMARGDVPVQRVNTNDVKDQVSSMLGRDFPGGMIRFPIWAEDWLFKQLTAEIRTPKGWENLTRKRNEAWDLLVYAVALLLHASIRFHFIDWTNPPGFAAEWDENDLVIPADGVVDTRGDDGDGMTLAQLAEKLG